MSASLTANVANTGGYPDVFDLTTSSDLGWPVDLFEADGVTPLVDTDADGTVDTGTVAGLQTHPIVITVTVPAGTPLDALNLAVVTATSSLDIGQTDDVKFRVEVLGPPTPLWPTYQHDDARTGVAPDPFELPISEVWTYSGTGGGASWTSPVVANGMVYYGAWSGYLMAVDALTGDEVWSTKVGPEFYFVGTPVVSDGKVFITYVEDGTFMNAVSGLDADTGAILWTYYTAGFPSRGTPVVKAGAIYFGDSIGWVYALDAETGSLLWTYQSLGQIVQGPSIVEGLVVAGNLASEVFALDLDGALVWSQMVSGWVLNAPSGAAGSVYVGDLSGTVYALDSQTGTIQWSSSGLGPIVFSTPAYDQGSLYAGNDFGDVFSLDAGTGSVRWSTSVSWSFESSVIVNNGTVFAAALDGYLYLLDAASGSVISSELVGPFSITSSPAAVKGYLYVSDEDGRLTAFAFTGAGVAATIDIAPPTATITVGDTLVLDAVGFDKYGNPTPDQEYLWSVTSGVGSVLPISETGDKALFVAGVDAGDSVIRVDGGPVSDTITVTVSPGPLDRIALSPLVATVTAGGTLEFNATALDRFGNMISGLNLTWSASTGLGTVSTAGVLTAATTVASGTVTVSVGNISASAQVSIAPGPLSAIVITPSEVNVDTGGGQALVAQGVDQYGNEISGVSFTWTTTIGTVTPLDGGQAATFTAGEDTGTGTITASSGGVSESVTVTITQAQLSLPTQFIQPLAIAFLATVIALAAIVAYLFVINQRMRRRLREGGGGEGGAGGEA